MPLQLMNENDRKALAQEIIEQLRLDGNFIVAKVPKHVKQQIKQHNGGRQIAWIMTPLPLGNASLTCRIILNQDGTFTMQLFDMMNDMFWQGTWQ